MGAYDTIVLVIILATTFFGWRKGLATQLASIISMVASFVVAVRFREPLAAHIDAEAPWNRFAAMLVLYLGTSLVIWIAFRQIRTSIERMKLGEFDRQMGAIFGAVKGVVIAGVVTMFAFTLLQEPQRRMIIDSKSGVWIARFLHQATAIMPDEIRRFVAPYLQNLNQGLGTPTWPKEPSWPGTISDAPPAPPAPWAAPAIPPATYPAPNPAGPSPDYEYRPARAGETFRE
jgi:membrane protein required for colicin V production